MKRVGRELGVRYILEGSVRKAGGRVRITAQLIEATTGTHLWADKFDGSLEDVFDLQDRVAISVAGVIEPTLRQTEIERARRKRPESLDAYDLYLRALPNAFTAMPGDADKALPLLAKAIEQEPDNAPRMQSSLGAMSSGICAVVYSRKRSSLRCTMRDKLSQKAEMMRLRSPPQVSSSLRWTTTTRPLSMCSTDRSLSLTLRHLRLVLVL